MRTTGMFCVALWACVSVATANDLTTAVAACDLDKSGNLDLVELTACFEKLDVEAQQAASTPVPPPPPTANDVAKASAEDLLDFKPGERATVAEAVEHLRRRARSAEKTEDEPLISPRLIIGRKLTDATDPRKADTNVPFVFSFTDDRGEGDDAFIAVGNVGYQVWNQDLAKPLRMEASFTPTLGFDVTTKTASSESTISAGLPFRFIWDRPKGAGPGLINVVEWGIEPKYITDRDMRRDVVELALSGSFWSEKLLRAGYASWFGAGTDPRLQHIVHWEPTLGVELGNVNDAGGNEKLLAIQAAGNYVRIAPGVSFKWRPPQLGRRVTFSLAYTHRVDVEQDWDRGFGGASVQYNLSSHVALTLAYRKGRKPPDFADTDEVLLGIGLQQAPAQKKK